MTTGKTSASVNSLKAPKWKSSGFFSPKSRVRSILGQYMEIKFGSLFDFMSLTFSGGEGQSVG